MVNVAPKIKPLILIVDDEEDIGFLLGEVLRRAGYATEVVYDGEEAIEWCSQQLPDLVLMDVKMPRKNGLEACAAIRALPDRANLPIVMLTALNTPDLIEQAFEVGATDYLLKPVHVSALLNRVHSILQAQQAGATLHSLQSLTEDAAATTPLAERLLRNLPGMVYRSHYLPVWHMEYASARAYELTGCTAQQLTQGEVNYYDLIHPEDRPSVWESVRYALAQQDNFQLMYRLLTPQGIEKWVLEQGVVVSSDARQQVVEGYISDITERKYIEDAMLQERALLRTMIDNLPHFIFVKDRNGRFVVSNVANAHHVGMERPSQVIGKRNSDFYPPDLAARYDEDDHHVMQAGEGVFHWEEEAVNARTGTKHWYAITKIPMTDSNGEVGGIVGMIRDITEAKQGEAEMKIANERLAELNELKSHFLLKISHELRTPLNSITGYTDMLLQGLNGPLNEKQQDRLQRVAANARSLLEMIDDLLDLSKIQTNQMSIRLQPIALERLAQEVVQSFDGAASQRGLFLTLDAQAQLPLVQADAAALLKVLMHLVENSIKFTRQGEVSIRVRLPAPHEMEAHQLADEGRQWALLEVRDTGRGIPAEKLTTLFDEFRQVDNSPLRQQGGSGLGLAISYKLMKLMGGRIWLESVDGQGTTARLLLPCVEPGPTGA